MKTNNIYKSFLIVIMVSLSISCEDETPAYEQLTDSKENAQIFIAKAVNGAVDLEIFPYADQRETNFGIGFGGVGLPASDISVKLEINQTALDSLNQIRVASGRDPYLIFPSDAYEIGDLSFTIPAGKQSSGVTKLTYFPNKFDSSSDFALPLTIVESSGYNVNPSTKNIIFLANAPRERVANTNGWIATASSSQDNGWENTGLASALLDGDLNTIWHSEYSPTTPGYPHTVSFDMTKKIFVTKVQIAPRQNNNSGPTKFYLEGTNGGDWIKLTEELDFNPANIDFQEYVITGQTLDKIRMVMTEGRQTVSFLSEFKVFAF
ncbi:DUF1735 domain-containing protein [Polaribacter haliotis]|uniref:DUF1735 domain-containing protein n=1 Tax=Polaribacter haliotis TaxID=1888915 RepID=A0A7L8AK58_9FLAO|nr:DUF1735 domain-containing protein [Polaribacter haliotis]QOD62347.1 DUF1735 domain-containing protein [Polaribacter haliotis]